MIPLTKYSVLVQFCVNNLVLNSLRYKIQKKSRSVCRGSVDYFVVVYTTREGNLFPLPEITHDCEASALWDGD
jgi:hypothetical protein